MATLHLTGDDRADELVSNDPLALLIGMVLDQQFPIERAFRGPAELVERLGISVPIDAGLIASTDPGVLVEAFARFPSLHRYPASMAARVQALCRVVRDEYGGDASSIWSTAGDGMELRARVEALPGFGAQKARIFVALCGKQLGARPPGWEEASAPYGEAGSFRSVADIVDAASLAEVRRRKQEAKARARAGAEAEAGAGAGAGAGASAPRRRRAQPRRAQ